MKRPSLKTNAYYNHIEKHIQNVKKNMKRIQSWITFGINAFAVVLLLDLLHLGVNVWLVLIGYSLVFWILSGFFDLEDEKSMKKWERYREIIVPLCSIIAITSFVLILIHQYVERLDIWIILLLVCVFSVVILIRKRSRPDLTEK